MTVANSLALLKENVTEEEKKKAMILGWCIEWVGLQKERKRM